MPLHSPSKPATVVSCLECAATSPQQARHSVVVMDACQYIPSASPPQWCSDGRMPVRSLSKPAMTGATARGRLPAAHSPGGVSTTIGLSRI
eukprot:365125-Chlamydomonas_euryale.AAC.6